MTIQDVFNKYKGQSLLVPGANPSDSGQCVQAADYFLHEVYGLPYVWLNAIDFWNKPDANLKANFDFIPYSPSMAIKEGDFVIYGTGVGSPYGHISTAGQSGIGSNYLGYDSNWGHNLTLHAQPHNDSYNQYILGILRNKGDNEVMLSLDDRYKVWRMARLVDPTPDEVKSWEGMDDDTFTNNLWNNGGSDWGSKAEAIRINDIRAEKFKELGALPQINIDPDKAGIDAIINKVKSLGTQTKDSVISYLQEKLQ